MDIPTINQAEQLAERQKQTGVSQIAEVAKAVHGAANDLQDRMPQAAELVHAAASQLDRSADFLRGRSIHDLTNELNEFGRQNPFAVFNGAMVAGFAIARFLKSGPNGFR